MSRNRLAILFTAILIGTIAVVGATHRDLAHEFWSAVAAFPLAAVAAALFIVFGQVAAQSLRLWAIVPGDVALPPGWVAAAFMAGECANIVAPVRAGDALKVVLLTRVPGPTQIGTLRAAGAVLADKLVDLGSLVLLCLVAGLSTLIWTGGSARVPGSLVVIGIAIAVPLAWVGLRLAPARWITTAKVGLAELSRGLTALRDPVRLAGSLSFSLAAWGAEVLAIRVLAGSLGFPMSASQLLFALVVMNAGTSVPVAAANAGVYEATLAYGLHRSGVPVAPALAIATTHHLIELAAISLSTLILTLAYRPHRGEVTRGRTPCASNAPSGPS